MIPVYPLAKKVILCIDDDPSILRYETALLERSGCSVLTASSGREALHLVETHHCDAVLLDYQMPGMYGHDVASEIQRRKPELVIILLSGGEVPSHALTVVDAFVPKLEASQQLLPIIAELCSSDQDTRRRRESA